MGQCSSVPSGDVSLSSPTPEAKPASVHDVMSVSVTLKKAAPEATLAVVAEAPAHEPAPEVKPRPAPAPAPAPAPIIASAPLHTAPAPAAAGEALRDTDTDAKKAAAIAKYTKMHGMCLPELAVRNKMQEDGVLSVAEQDHFFTVGLPRAAAGAREEAGETETDRGSDLRDSNGGAATRPTIAHKHQRAQPTKRCFSVDASEPKISMNPPTEQPVVQEHVAAPAHAHEACEEEKAKTAAKVERLAKEEYEATLKMQKIKQQSLPAAAHFPLLKQAGSSALPGLFSRFQERHFTVMDGGLRMYGQSENAYPFGSNLKAVFCLGDYAVLTDVVSEENSKKNEVQMEVNDMILHYCSRDTSVDTTAATGTGAYEDWCPTITMSIADILLGKGERDLFLRFPVNKAGKKVIVCDLLKAHSRWARKYKVTQEQLQQSIEDEEGCEVNTASGGLFAKKSRYS